MSEFIGSADKIHSTNHSPGTLPIGVGVAIGVGIEAESQNLFDPDTDTDSDADEAGKDGKIVSWVVKESCQF